MKNETSNSRGDAKGTSSTGPFIAQKVSNFIDLYFLLLYTQMVLY